MWKENVLVVHLRVVVSRVRSVKVTSPCLSTNTTVLVLHDENAVLNQIRLKFKAKCQCILKEIIGHEGLVTASSIRSSLGHLYCRAGLRLNAHFKQTLTRTCTGYARISFYKLVKVVMAAWIHAAHSVSTSLAVVDYMHTWCHKNSLDWQV